MKKIIAIILGVLLLGVTISFTTAKTIQERTKTEIVYVNGMKYVVFHSNETIQIANVTKDLLEIESYKKK